MIFIAGGPPGPRIRAPSRMGQPFDRALSTEEVRTPKAKPNWGKTQHPDVRSVGGLFNLWSGGDDSVKDINRFPSNPMSARWLKKWLSKKMLLIEKRAIPSVV